MKYNVFGQKLEVLRQGDKWEAFYLGNEGKKRLAHDIIIPATIEEQGILQYLSDLLHEWANNRHNSVEHLD